MGKMKRNKKQKQKDIICPFSFESCVDECFDINNDNYKKMMKIIEEQKILYGTQRMHGNEVHHIVPRSYYRKKGYIIDNSDINLVSLETRYHFQVHYYAYQCAKPFIKRSLTYAFQMMMNKYKKICDEEDLISASILYENFKNSKPLPKKYQKKYTDEELHNFRIEHNKKMWSEKRDLLIQSFQGKKHTITEDFKLLEKEKIDYINHILSIVDNELQDTKCLKRFIHFLNPKSTMNLKRYNFQIKKPRHMKPNLIYCKELDLCMTKKEWSDVFSVSERTIQDCKNMHKKLFNEYSFEDFGQSEIGGIFDIILYFKEHPSELEVFADLVKEKVNIIENTLKE